MSSVPSSIGGEKGLFTVAQGLIQTIDPDP